MSKSIVKACMRYNDRLYTGFDHGECFKKLNEDNMIIVYNRIEQGFIDSDGNFVDRKPAMIIAKEAGQLRYEPSKKTLISEDLHLDWLNKQAQRIAELEEQLKNAIVPKFKVGQEVYLADTYFDKVYDLKISSISILRSQHSNHISYDGHLENTLFVTEEEAQERLNNYEKL